MAKFIGKTEASKANVYTLQTGVKQVLISCTVQKRLVTGKGIKIYECKVTCEFL